MPSNLSAVSAETATESRCEVCGRGLLPGERPTKYLTRDGAEATVCELCRPRAEAAGWLRPEEATARGGVGRERRRPRGQMIGNLLSRLPAPANGEGDGEEAEPPARDPVRARRRARATAPDAEVLSAQPKTADAGIGLSDALAAFNATDHRRTVAGLSRTLGAPRATELAVEGPDGRPGARLTVAWELTWYQWDVTAGTDGAEVRESGKGETIDQLNAADRAWNLLVSADGTLERRSATEEPAE
jgi:hypothetical protein